MTMTRVPTALNLASYRLAALFSVLALAVTTVAVTATSGGAADDGPGASPLVAGPSPVISEFNGGSCSVDPFSTSVAFDAGETADGNQNNVWNGTFADGTATVGVAIQNFQSGTTMTYRPWVGLAAYDGRTILGAVAEFSVTAGADEGAEWTFETLPAGNGAVGSSFSVEPTSTNAATGAFTVELPTRDDSRAWGHKAGWVVSSASHADATSYPRAATITVTGATLSPLPGENSRCQQLFWDGTPQPVVANGELQANGLTVNVDASQAGSISGVVTSANGTVITDSQVVVASDGTVSVSVPEGTVDDVVVQLAQASHNIGSPFAQPVTQPSTSPSPAPEEPTPAEPVTETVVLGDTEVTFEAELGDHPSGELVLNSSYSDNPAQFGALPGDAQFNFGAHSFELNVAVGSTATVTLVTETPANTLFKSIDNEWAQYPAVFDGTAITFELVDGGAGDADGEANGVIVDPVAPAVVATFTG